MKRLLAAIAALMSLMLASCVSLGGDTSGSGSGAGSRSGSGAPADLTIVAATELKDLEGLVDQAAKDLKVDDPAAAVPARAGSND